MNNVRCGERATFAGLFVLSTGALCVALAACSSGSDSGGTLGGWGGTASSNGNGNGASGPTGPTGGNAGSGSGSGSGGGTTVNVDASTPAADAGARTGKDGGVADAGPVEDTGSAANTFSLLNTNVTTLVDGETIFGYDPIPNNSVLDLSKVGTALSVRANTTPTIVDHVDFVMDGTYTHTERAAPYTLCGDNGNGTITNCIQYFTSGAHMLTITVYALAPDAGPDGGPPLDSTTLYFSVTSSEAGAPDAGGGG